MTDTYTYEDYTMIQRIISEQCSTLDQNSDLKAAVLAMQELLEKTIMFGSVAASSFRLLKDQIHRTGGDMDMAHTCTTTLSLYFSIEELCASVVDRDARNVMSERGLDINNPTDIMTFVREQRMLNKSTSETN